MDDGATKKKYREEFTPYFFFLQENTMCIR